MRANRSQPYAIFPDTQPAFSFVWCLYSVIHIYNWCWVNPRWFWGLFLFKKACKKPDTTPYSLNFLVPSWQALLCLPWNCPGPSRKPHFSLSQKGRRLDTGQSPALGDLSWEQRLKPSSPQSTMCLFLFITQEPKSSSLISTIHQNVAILFT